MTDFNGEVLALDLATSTGWCTGVPGGKPRFGSLRFGNASADRPARYRAMREWLSVMITPKTRRVIFESSAVPSIMMGRTNIDTIKLLVGFCEHLEEFCHGRVELREARTADVRRYFIGGNPKRAVAKPAVMQRCKALGWDVKNDDEGDACAVWAYQIGILRPDLSHKTTPLFSRI